MDERIPTDVEVNEMTDTEFKILENRLRRAARRQGMQLVKSRSRDPRAIDYAGYMLVDIESGGVVAGELGSPRVLSTRDVALHLWGDE